MQYDRNDEITYDKEFLETTNKEYYNPEDYKNNDEFCSEEKVFSEKKKKPLPTVILCQLIICILLGIFLYCSRTYAPDFFSNIMSSVSDMINDSLVVDGNNLNDYFVNNG